MPLLNEIEVEEKLKSMPGWEKVGDCIQKKYKLKDFVEAMSFVLQVAFASELMDHHPDILINYSRVTFTLSTHSERGLTEKDFALAAKIESLARTYQ